MRSFGKSGLRQKPFRHSYQHPVPLHQGCKDGLSCTEIQNAMYRERGRWVTLGTSLPTKRRLHWPGDNRAVLADPEPTLMPSSAGLIPAASLVGFQFVKPIIAGVSLCSDLSGTIPYRSSLDSLLQTWTCSNPWSCQSPYRQLNYLQSPIKSTEATTKRLLYIPAILLSTHNLT